MSRVIESLEMKFRDDGKIIIERYGGHPGGMIEPFLGVGRLWKRKEYLKSEGSIEIPAEWGSNILSINLSDKCYLPKGRKRRHLLKQ